MFNFDYITKENITKNNPNWPEIPTCLQKILIAGGSRSGRLMHYLI